MARQQTQISTQNIVESVSGSNGLGPESGESVTVRASEDRPLEKGERDDVETSPTNLTNDHPDGGFAAWCVVFGVSKLHLLAFLVA
jgi:hypothetical protein